MITWEDIEIGAVFWRWSEDWRRPLGFRVRLKSDPALDTVVMEPLDPRNSGFQAKGQSMRFADIERLYQSEGECWYARHAEALTGAQEFAQNANQLLAAADALLKQAYAAGYPRPAGYKPPEQAPVIAGLLPGRTR